MSTQNDIKIAVKNINQFLESNTNYHASIAFDKGNQEQGITHKIFINRRGNQTELFRAKTLTAILDRLVGFDYGLREFGLFKQR